MNPRRELTAVLAVAVVGSASALLASGQGWLTVTVRRPAPLPPVSTVATGGEAAPVTPAFALVLLAAAGALLAVRGAGRIAVGLLMVLAAAGIVWSSGRVLAGRDAFSDGLLSGAVAPADLVRDVAPVWPVLAVVGGVLGAAAGLLAAVRGRRWPGMGRRYERTGAAGPAPAPTDEQRAQSAWTALDRGLDPTSDPPDRPS